MVPWENETNPLDSLDVPFLFFLITQSLRYVGYHPALESIGPGGLNRLDNLIFVGENIQKRLIEASFNRFDIASIYLQAFPEHLGHWEQESSRGKSAFEMTICESWRNTMVPWRF